MNIPHIFGEVGNVVRHKFILVLACIVLVTIFAIAICAPMLTSYDPIQTGVGPTFQPPSYSHWMGTDDLGRDIFSGVAYGARISLGVGGLAAIASGIIGVIIGLFAGYHRGWVDAVLMRITEVFFVIPMVFLAILFVAYFDSSIWNIIAVISILSWPATARLVRGQVLSLRERPFVKAAQVIGESAGSIIFREILPNTRSPVIVNSSIQMAQAISVEAGLSFLGLGDPNLTSWGIMLYRAQRFLLQEVWWTFFFPGLSLFLTVLSLNVIADALNASLNVRTRRL